MARRRTTAMPQVIDAAVRVDGGWWLVHGLPLLTPLGGSAVYALLITGAYAEFSGDPVKTPLLALVFALLGAAVTWFGLATCGPRQHLKLLIGVTGVSATAMLVLVMVLGWAPMWIVYLIVSLVVEVLWVIWRGLKYSGAAAGQSEHPLADAVAAAKQQLSRPTVNERGVVTVQGRTLAGGTVDDARQLVPLITADPDVRAVPGSGHLVPHADRDGVYRIEFATRDNLRDSLPWPGLPKLGGLPTDFFPVGEYQAGPCRVRIVGDVDAGESDVSQLKIAGVTGSGKSTGARVVIGSLMAARKTNIIGLDLSTRMQVLGPLADGLTWLITEEEEARLFMARIGRVLAGRKDHLATEGLDRWSPRSSLNFLIIWIEESKAFGKFTRAYVDLVSDARAAGVWVVSSTQNWLYRSVSTDVRKQAASSICFGMTEADDVASILPAEVLAALGKDGLPTWGDSRPGYAIVTGMGVPRKLWPSLMRFYMPTREQMAEAVAAGAPYRDPMDPVTAGLFGELYARRTVPGRVMTATPTPTAGRPARRYVYDFDQEQEEGPEMEAEEQNAQDREELRRRLLDSRREAVGDDATPGDLADVDPETKINLDVDDDGEEADDTRPKPTPEEAQRTWDDLLDERYRSGGRTVSPGDVAEWLEAVGRERTFWYRQRDRWQRMGCIQPGTEPGSWDLVGSPYERARG